MHIPADTMTTAAALTRVSQSMIYKHLTNERGMDRKATQRTLDKIKTATKEIFGETPTDEAIWKSLRHKDITKKIQDFLWKQIHGIYKLGNFWTHIPGLKDRAEWVTIRRHRKMKEFRRRVPIAEFRSASDPTQWSGS